MTAGVCPAGLLPHRTAGMPPRQDGTSAWRARLRALGGLLAELRIDVDLSGRDIQREFDALHERLRSNHRARDAMRPLPLPLHGLELRMREADGEYFVYAIDPRPQRIVAYTVFSRLVEVDRATDRHLRAPHTRVADGYRRQGIASAIYRWWLASGRSLITGARQSAGAHGLWMALARDHELAAVRIDARKRLAQLTLPPPAGFFGALDTRLVLVGRGCRLADFAQPPVSPALPAGPPRTGW